MAGVNRVIIIGNLGKDAEVRQFGESTVCNFSVATSDKFKSKKTQEWVEETEWHRVQVWGKLAEECASLKKGQQVYVEGKNKTRSYEKNGVKMYSTEVVAAAAHVVGAKGEHTEYDAGSNRPDEDPVF